MLREAVKNKTEIGLKAKGLMDAGKLVSDEVVAGLCTQQNSLQVYQIYIT